jgi:hypothetical protein
MRGVHKERRRNIVSNEIAQRLHGKNVLGDTSVEKLRGKQMVVMGEEPDDSLNPVYLG